MGGSTTNDAEQPTSSTPSTTATKSTTQDVDVDVDADTTVDAKVNPAVEHTHVKKEKHQDHYHTTVQPLKDSEVLPEKHDYEQESKEKNINRDDSTAREKAANDTAGYQSSIDEKKLRVRRRSRRLLMSMCTITCMRRSSLLLRRRCSTHPSPTRESMSRRTSRSSPSTTA